MHDVCTKPKLSMLVLLLNNKFTSLVLIFVPHFFFEFLNQYVVFSFIWPIVWGITIILLELGKVSYNYVNYSQHNQANLASEPMTLILLKFYPNHHINY